MPSAKTETPKNPQALTVVDSIPLNRAGKSFSDRQITDGFNRADQAKKNFQIECIRTGLMLQVKKSELKHGQFKPYIEKLQNGRALPNSFPNKGNAISFSDGQKCSALHFSARYRTAVIYMKLAEYFSKWLNDKGQSVSLSDEGVMALLSPSAKNRKVAYKIADAFVGDRSLRRMLNDLRQAEKAAAEEGKSKKKPDNRKPDEIRAETREVIREDIAESINSLRKILKRPGIEFLEPEDFEEFSDHLKYTAKEYATLAGYTNK